MINLSLFNHKNYPPPEVGAVGEGVNGTPIGFQRSCFVNVFNVH